MFLIAYTFSLYSQKEISYVSPPDIIGEGYKIIIANAVSEKDNTKFKVTVYNTSRDHYLTVDPRKIGIDYPGLGVYYPNPKLSMMEKKNIVIPPGERKSKSIKITGDFDHRAADFQVHFDGLKRGPRPEKTVPMEIMELSPGNTGPTETDALTIEVSKVSQNKTALAIQTKLMFGNQNDEHDLILLDPAKVKATTPAGKAVTLSTSPSRLSVIDFDSDQKVTLKAEGTHQKIRVNWGDAFKKIHLNDVTVAICKLVDEKAAKRSKGSKSSTTSTTTPVAAVRTCPAVNLNKDGSIKMKIVSEVGCFKVISQGESLTPEFTSSLTYMTDPGMLPAKIYMESGEVIEKKLIAGDDYKLVYYSIKEKKGKYSAKLSLINSQPAEQAAQENAAEYHCRDKMFMAKYQTIKENLTVVEITKTDVMYRDCVDPSFVIAMPKKSILQVEYANGTYDNFDFDGGKKQGMNIVRSKEEIRERHTPGVKPGQSTDGSIITGR